MKIFTYLHEILTKNRKNILYILLFFVFYFLLSDFTFATDPQTQAQNSNIFIEGLNGFLKIAAALLGLLTFLVGLFLYPEWTSGSIVGLGGSEGALKQMWIMISNVVYFIFAMIFIWIAFMNIIGKEENYELKKAIPKFIIGVIMVPFTWFFVQFVLSISSLLTVGVLSLPYDTFKDSYMKIEKLDQVKFCGDYVINTGSSTGSTFPIDCKKGSQDTISLADIVNPKTSDSLFGITAIYTYGIMSLDQQGKLFSANLSTINDILNLGLKLLFDLLFIVVYFLLMIALALALFVRGVYLWFYAMFSPVFGLLYFFDKQKDGIADGKFSVKEFISLALVPVYVSAALAFGLLFIFSAGNAITKQSNILQDNGKKIEFAGFTYTLAGPAASDGSIKSEIGRLIEGFQGTFGTLLLQVFGLAILWMALMAALNQSKITQNVISPFEEFGKSIGSLASKAPTYMPILPGGLSPRGLAQVGAMPSQAIENRSSAIAGQFKDPIQSFFGGKIVDPNIIRKMNNIMDDGNGITAQELPELLRMQQDLVKEFGRNNAVVADMESKIAKVVGENTNLTSNQVGGANIAKLKQGDEKEIAKLIVGGVNGEIASDSDVIAYINAKNPNNNFNGTNQSQTQQPNPSQQVINLSNQQVNAQVFNDSSSQQLGTNGPKFQIQTDGDLYIAKSKTEGHQIRLSTRTVGSITDSDKKLLKDIFTQSGITDRQQIETILKNIYNVPTVQDSLTHSVTPTTP